MMNRVRTDPPKLRNRHCTRTSCGSITGKTMLLLAGAWLCLAFDHVDCFATTSRRHYSFVLEASRSATQRHSVTMSSTATRPKRGRKPKVVAQPVQPKTLVSDTKRKKAKRAMERQQQQRQVDAQMLQLLSEQFLYAEKPTENRERPRGRPAMVPGAMNYETVIQYRKRQQEQQELSKTALSPDQQRSLLEETTPTPAPAKRGRPKKSEVVKNGATAAAAKVVEEKNGKEKKHGTKAPKNIATIKKPLSVRKKSIKGSRKQTTAAQAKLKTATAPEKMKRKRVVKNLPKPRTKAQQEKQSQGLTKGGDPLHLQRYYRTELLSPQEEYSLGMKIQFMMQCEHVHEGLASKLRRLPTIEEWAVACGFEDPDPTFVPTEGDEQIRPAGSESMFEKVDPNTFVGNGLATNAGPGRGRGRVKLPPPLELGDFYDDSEIKFAKDNDGANLDDLEPINRGTALDFVEKMMDSRSAKQRMVQSNMRLVLSIARKYSKVGVSLPDLVQEGSLGLSRAAEKFEPSKGFKFSTYASWWIQQAVFRSIAYHSRTIRLPVHVHNLLNRVRRIKVSLEQDLGRAPTNEEIAEQLDMTVQKYNKMLSLTRKSISLEVPKYQSNPKDYGHESEDLLGETIDSSILLDESSPEKRVDRGLFRRDLREMLKILEHDERRVIAARYGLDDGLTRTVTAVAAQMKESKAWVRSQECRALRKLRRPWYEKRLKEHQNSLNS